MNGLEVSRRRFLRDAVVASAVGVPVLAARPFGGRISGSESDGTAYVGSQWSDPVPRESLANVAAAFTEQGGGDVEINTMDHETFPQQLTSYLQGRPDDVITWTAGYRMQFFADRDLLSPIDDVWADVGANFSDALHQQSVGGDGREYFLPFYYYPWAMFYRRSVFEEGGYEVPATLDDLVALSQQMESDELFPIAFADRDGWPAMGTFDIINLRTNGYDFHISLMAGEESWTDQRVHQVFDTWRELLPYHQPNALGRTWQEAAQTLASKSAGMYMMGLFVGQQFNDEDREDLDFFPFPEIDPSVGTDALDAPIDGFMLAREPRNEASAKELLRFLGTGEAEGIYLASDPNNIAASSDADTSGYSALQQKALELISSATSIAQFLDRDTRPDFASTVMLPAIQEFINNPDDIDGLLNSIEEQKAEIFSS